jgi:hypothetical protein
MILLGSLDSRVGNTLGSLCRPLMCTPGSLDSTVYLTSARFFVNQPGGLNLTVINTPGCRDKTWESFTNMNNSTKMFYVIQDPFYE